MSKKFSNKVLAERLILACANQFANDKTQLTGLTMRSISMWATLNQLGEGNRIESLLRKLSEMTYRMTDRSQESFESMDELHLTKIKEKIPELEALVCNYFKPHRKSEVNKAD